MSGGNEGKGLVHVVCFGDRALELQFSDPERDTLARHENELSAAAIAVVRAARCCAQSPAESHEHLMALLTAAEFLAGLSASLREEINYHSGELLACLSASLREEIDYHGGAQGASA